jgi:RNA polymerase sigma-70 factor (ECF subfamily)
LTFVTAAARKDKAQIAPHTGDDELASSAASGDVAALGALYDRYAPALMAVAYRLLMSRSDAEDVLHDVFVGLPEALRRYEERGALASWLKRVTVRVALSRMRREEARDAITLDAALAAPSRDVAASIDLEVAVASLPSSLRTVLLLKEVEGYSHAEIAEVVGISVAASKVRLHRALRALRTLLEERER